MILRHARNPGLLCLAVLGAACARPVVVAPAPDPEPQSVRLDEAGIAALAALLRMEDSRVLDTTLVAQHLDAAMPEVRARAVLAAGRIRDGNALPLIMRTLADESEAVRESAAFALGQLGDSSVAVMSALSMLALRDVPGPASQAVGAIGRLGSPAGRAAVDSLLAAPGRPAALVHEALLAAWRLPHDAGTLANIARWTTHADPETRWRAAYALARTGGAAGVAPLLEITTDADHRVRSYAVRGLRAARADSAGVRERALGALLSAARDPHPHVRINALALLAGYRSNERTTPYLAAALADPDHNVAIAAAQGLAQTGDAAAAGALYPATRPGSPDGLRTAALHAWMRVDSSGAGSIALQWADSARWLLRLHAARALARAPSFAALPALHALARDSHYLVAAEALGSVRLIADSVPNARHLFIEQLGASHALVRAAAIRGLAPHVGAADLDLLLQAYDRARRDSVRDAASAAVMALARIRRAGVPVERTFFLRFGTHGAPDDGTLHRLIIDSIGVPPPSWGEPVARINVRAPEYYAGMVRTYVAPALAGGALPRVVIRTSHGDIVLELAAAHAPITVHNFLSLIDDGYYRDTRWHRVVPNFVIQDGDPRGDGSGGPGYAIRDEINPLRYDRGTLGMALSGPDTGGSQFFITHSPQPHLDGGYTVFGRVGSGMDVVDRVVQEDPIVSIRVVR